MKIDPQDDAGHGHKPFSCPLLRYELFFYLHANCLFGLNLNLFAKSMSNARIAVFMFAGLRGGARAEPAEADS